MIEFKNYKRKSFPIEAVEITEENMDAVAELIGEVVQDSEGVRSIVIQGNKVPHIRRAYVGWWLTNVDGQMRCYMPTVFADQFEEDVSAATG